MATVKGKHEFEAEWNGQKGKFVLMADLNIGQLNKIMKNCVNFDPDKGLTLDTVNFEEYVVQVSQKIIKEAPPGFDLNKPDNLRELDPDTWFELEDFIGQYYPPMRFFSRRLGMASGKKFTLPSSNQPTESISNVEGSSDGNQSKSTDKTPDS